MGGAGDKFQPEGNVAIALVCAICKQPAEPNHECKVVITSEKEIQNESSANPQE